MQMMKKISDVGYAAVLIFKNYKLIDVEWANGKATWVFQDNECNADNVIRAYINDELKGSLKRFVQSQQIIRQTLFK